MEDVTREEEVEKNPKCDRRVTLYGYNRGQAIKKDQAIHIAGKTSHRVLNILIMLTTFFTFNPLTTGRPGTARIKNAFAIPHRPGSPANYQVLAS